jgi:hypothetical protein
MKSFPSTVVALAPGASLQMSTVRPDFDTGGALEAIGDTNRSETRFR